jgi:hypothetical protein
MPAQDRELRKNYIGILSDRDRRTTRRRIGGESDHFMKDYLFGLVAAVPSRDSHAR